jgi:hypothetical protein
VLEIDRESRVQAREIASRKSASANLVKA